MRVVKKSPEEIRKLAEERTRKHTKNTRTSASMQTQQEKFSAYLKKHGKSGNISPEKPLETKEDRLLAVAKARSSNINPNPQKSLSKKTTTTKPIKQKRVKKKPNPSTQKSKTQNNKHKPTKRQATSSNTTQKNKHQSSKSKTKKPTNVKKYTKKAKAPNKKNSNSPIKEKLIKTGLALKLIREKTDQKQKSPSLKDKLIKLGLASGFIQKRVDADCIWEEGEEILSSGPQKAQTKKQATTKVTKVEPTREQHLESLALRIKQHCKKKSNPVAKDLKAFLNLKPSEQSKVIKMVKKDPNAKKSLTIFKEALCDLINKASLNKIPNFAFGS